MMYGKRRNWSADVAMVSTVAIILGLMVLPLPTLVIDILLAINLGISVLLLMVTLYAGSVIGLSSFPSLLLVTTMFRLGLNIASTKAILLTADAGHIIEAFGNLVVGGNMLVGLVVFLIITIVQFIVIAKGSERVAEVGARFTLDAMPGKQMSIDADLRAGSINAEEARRRRSNLAMESQLHGGMDGAMKFVKGDAVAGLIITAINVLAGIAVGVLHHGMTAGEAANRFSILAIGDAMVSQIPSLLICLSAGVIITRVANEMEEGKPSLGQEIGKQMTASPQAMYLAATMMCGFAFVPGFPWPVFLILAAACALGARYMAKKGGKVAAGGSDHALPALQRDGGSSQTPGVRDRPALYSVPLAIRLSPSAALHLQGDALNNAFETERAKLQVDLGLPFPGVRLWQSVDCTEGRYEILVHDVPVASGTLQSGKLLIPLPGEAVDRCEAGAAAGGFDPSHWVSKDALASLPAGTIALDHESVLARHAVTILHDQAHLFLGLPEVQWLMEKLTSDYASLVAEVQKVVPMQRVAEVLRRLLEEQVPIRGLRSIFESLITWGPREKDVLMLTEYVRIDLSRMMTHRASGGAASLSAVLLDPGVEKLVRDSIKATPTGNFLAMAPEQMAAIGEKVVALTGEQARLGVALVTAVDVRRYVRRIIESRLRWLQVYSFNELGPDLKLEPLGRVRL